MLNDLANLVAVLIAATIIWSLYYRWMARHESNPDAKIEESHSDTGPLPFDENDPPKFMVYKPKTPGHYLECTCHKRRLILQQKVLIWPLGSGKSVIFCENGVRENA